MQQISIKNMINKLPRSRAVEVLIENHFSSRSKASGNLPKEIKIIFI